MKALDSRKNHETNPLKITMTAKYIGSRPVSTSLNPGLLRMRRDSRSGFTLIELLVVVGIVAILSALTFAATSAAFRAAKRAGCLAHMRTIGVSTITYAGDHDQNYPLTDNPAWDVALDPYLETGSQQAADPVLECPADPRPLVTGGGYARSYSFNGGLPNTAIQVGNPAQTILLAEWYSSDASNASDSGTNFQYGQRYDIVTYTTGSSPSAPGSAGYHGPTSNFIFADGHAESLNPNSTTFSPYVWNVLAQ